MKKKLKLNDLKVQSFVTNLEKEQVIDVKGGLNKDTINLQMCTALSCGIVSCTYTLPNC